MADIRVSNGLNQANELDALRSRLSGDILENTLETIKANLFKDLNTLTSEILLREKALEEVNKALDFITNPPTVEAPAVEEAPTLVGITEKEKNVLINIIENEYTSLNGAIPENYDQCTPTWLDSEIIEECGPMDTVSGKALGGVLSSLEKKGFIVMQIEKAPHQNESSVWATEEGFEVYQTFGRE